MNYTGGSYKKEADKCPDCKELTFKTVENGYYICQGCEAKRPYERQARVYQNHFTENPDQLSESDGLFYKENSDIVLDAIEDVSQRFHKLSATERQVVQLAWEGKNTLQISDILGVDASDVYVYLNRIRNKLR